ncbi:putative cyclin-D7-1 [Herrania umbratica]|uniref:Cyclin-D7-1 n=1 Tax=Herrania umbratica TaxID=108875 RepID=A0A6J1ASU6_9ROSI|nr:putative cyclin-D7-1 [Herrania umbratica]
MSESDHIPSGIVVVISRNINFCTLVNDFFVKGKRKAMENLLCDEVWLSSPGTPDHSHDEREHCMLKGYADSFYTTKEDSEQAFVVCLEKEFSYMPEPGYLDHLQSNNLVFARFRAVQWLIKTCTRLNLSVGTVFNSTNYLDRFLSVVQCHGWEHWMVELLSVACLSIASKFNETSLPSLDELQMEDLDHSFQSSTIQQMELKLLQALKWRLGSTTVYSYIELITSNIICLKCNLQKELINQVTKTLLRAELDIRLLRYPPSVVAISALWCSLEKLFPLSYNVYLTNIMRLMNQDHEDDIIKCRRIMKAWLVDPFYSLKASDEQSYYYPSSPVTVLSMERIDHHINDCRVDLSLFTMPGSNANCESIATKRKREEE